MDGWYDGADSVNWRMLGTWLLWRTVCVGWVNDMIALGILIRIWDVAYRRGARTDLQGDGQP